MLHNSQFNFQANNNANNININKTSEEIKKTFLNYFKRHNHKEIKSSSLIGDSSLMFTNAGMVQFKDYFIGKKKPNDLNITTSQNCVRAGGKHNDLENVGHTKRHHTFFEMLGNFSFGGYFKEEAIKYAWDLLREFQIDKNKLIITVYHTDDESYKLWQKIANLTTDRIIKIKTNDNFWSMGDLGPCGPCSEIFYDYGPSVSGGLPGTKDQDGDRYVEIWNLVFMQYEKTINGLMDLPTKCIDTGMGLERLSSVIQGVTDNYENDVFKYLISEIKTKIISNKDKELFYCYKIIADHIRAIIFLISSGIMPSNEGRGYVLRRIIRRMTWHSNLLGNKVASAHKLLPSLLNLYPTQEIISQQKYIEQILYDEEDRFLHLINKGKNIIGNICKDINNKQFSQNELENNLIITTNTNCNLVNHNKQNSSNLELHHNFKENKNLIKKQTKIDPKISFMLYDTYGFPIDLIKNVLCNYNIKFDEDEFNIEMQKQKTMGKNSWNQEDQNNEDIIVNSDKYANAKISISKEILEYLSENNLLKTNFIGYDHNNCSSYITAILHKKEEFKNIKLSEDNYVWLAFESTVFYGESGGQAGDIGKIIINELEINVLDTKKIDDLHLHLILLPKNIELKLAITAYLEINFTYRQNLKNHHTATHLLHSTLQKNIGTHVTQKGSFVGNDILRFDFNNNTPLDANTLKKIEAEINEIIFEKCNVVAEIYTKELAKEAGAMSLFSDKYKDIVRVIKVLKHNNKNYYQDDNNVKLDSKNFQYHSIELCGGTHVANTSEIGLFKIISERSVASGIRRIEAKCGKYAFEYLNSFYEKFNEIQSLLNAKLDAVLICKDLIEKNKQNTKEIERLKLSTMQIDKTKIINISENINLYIENILEDMIFAKKLLEHHLNKNQNMIICYINDSKFVIGKTKDVKFSIKNLMQKFFEYNKKGKGGGNDIMFQGDFEHKIDQDILKVFFTNMLNNN
ncbi:MAG: alanine--tRNA ligase [Rickettsiales bacterium]